VFTECANEIVIEGSKGELSQEDRELVEVAAYDSKMDLYHDAFS
jgi:hypothetical protein